MMDLRDWAIDPTSLPGPDRRLWPGMGLYDRFFEIPVSDTGCLVYSVAEVRMNCEVGLLAVYRYKHQPLLVFNSQRLLCFATDDTVQWNRTGDILFVQVYTYREICFAILDLAHERFSFLGGTDLSVHGIEQDDETTFRLIYYNRKPPARNDVRQFRLNELPWFSISQIDQFVEIYRGELATDQAGEA